MRVLVGYASAHGSTAQIARRIAEVLEREGLTVELLSLRQVQGLRGYDGVVLGSAIHNQTWMPEGCEFVRLHADALVVRPVWLFSVGMSGGLPRWIRGAARSGQNRRLADALRDMVRPRGHLLLSGVAAPEQFPPWVGTLFRVSGAHFGDYRDWATIEAWATDIARELKTRPEAFSAGH
jgi:menaquinone-dependent protoporphyrinogen oxidase